MAIRAKFALIPAITWLLIVLIVLASGIRIAIQWRGVQQSELQVGKTVPLLSGRVLEGRVIDSAAFADATCILVRFESRWCPFSNADSLTFDQLERRALANGCASVIVAPDADSFLCQSDPSGMPHEQHTHLSHPALASLNSLRLSATPTTIMLRKPHRVGWRKVGTLADGDVEAALTLLGSR